MTATAILSHLRHAHANSGLTVAEVARLSGVQQHVVAGVLDGTRTKPSLETVVKLAGAFNLKLELTNQPETGRE
jgi:transcriptional regulator with XRE-family HTH domain